MRTHGWTSGATRYIRILAMRLHIWHQPFSMDSTAPPSHLRIWVAVGAGKKQRCGESCKNMGMPSRCTSCPALSAVSFSIICTLPVAANLAGFIESWGRGIEKICTACQEDGIPLPEYTKSGIQVGKYVADDMRMKKCYDCIVQKWAWAKKPFPQL